MVSQAFSLCGTFSRPQYVGGGQIVRSCCCVCESGRKKWALSLVLVADRWFDYARGAWLAPGRSQAAGANVLKKICGDSALSLIPRSHHEPTPASALYRNVHSARHHAKINFNFQFHFQLQFPVQVQGARQRPSPSPSPMAHTEITRL